MLPLPLPPSLIVATSRVSNIVSSLFFDLQISVWSSLTHWRRSPCHRSLSISPTFSAMRHDWYVWSFSLPINRLIGSKGRNSPLGEEMDFQQILVHRKHRNDLDMKRKNCQWFQWNLLHSIVDKSNEEDQQDDGEICPISLQSIVEECFCLFRREKKAIHSSHLRLEDLCHLPSKKSSPINELMESNEKEDFSLHGDTSSGRWCSLIFEGIPAWRSLSSVASQWKRRVQLISDEENSMQLDDDPLGRILTDLPDD